MGLPSQGRGTGAGGSRGSKSKRLRLPPGVIPIVLVGVAIAAVWGGMKLIGPADADAGQSELANANDSTANTNDTGSRPGGQGLLGGALEESASRTGAGGSRSDRLSTALPDRGELAEGIASTDEPEITDPIASEATLAMIERAAEAPTPARSSSIVENSLDESESLVASNQLVAARAELSDTLADGGLTGADQQRLRAALTDLNNIIVFSPRIIPGDTMVEEYRIKAGDSLAKITRARELGVHWKLIQRINGIDRPERIRTGQRLKLVRGPFHAVVHKGEYRVDIYQGPPDEPERWVFITSRPVGLGLDDSTPVGRFVVRQNAKLENPAWVNPRDPSDRFGRNDPDNPIGEFWIGLDGLGDDAVYVGYGLHGTIEPDSVGRQESMGCVRMYDDDIALLYELLEEGASIVEIVP